MRKVIALLFLVLASVPSFALPSFAQTPGPNIDVTTALINLINAGAGTTDSPDQTNSFAKGVVVGINTTVNSGTVSVTVAIQGKDRVSGQYYSICTSAALAATAFTTLSTYPGQAATANVACALPLPPTWRVHVVSGAGVSPNFNMTIGAGLIH